MQTNHLKTRWLGTSVFYLVLAAQVIPDLEIQRIQLISVLVL